MTLALGLGLGLGLVRVAGEVTGGWGWLADIRDALVVVAVKMRVRSS